MSWLSKAIGKDARQEKRARQQLVDPNGRTVNDTALRGAREGSAASETMYGGRVDTSRAASDAATQRLGGGSASRSDRLAGNVPGAAGGPPPIAGQDSRGGIPGQPLGGPSTYYSGREGKGSYRPDPNENYFGTSGASGGVTAVGGGTPAWQSSFAPGGGGPWTADDSRTSGPTGGNGPTPGGMTRGWNPTNVQGLSFDAISRSTPGATDAYSTDSLDNYDSENLRGVDAGATIDRYTGGPNRFAQAMSGANLAAWDDGGVGAFDAGAALKEYATGAWNDTKMDLGNLLTEQEAASQRGGRLNSGFFDRDKGRVITDSTNRFSNALAQQAVQAAGITGDMKARAAQMRLSQAGDRDRLMMDGLGLGLEAGQSVTDAELERASGMDSNRLNAIRSGRELALDKSQFTDDYRFKAADRGATLDLDRAKSLDEMGLDKSKSVDAWDQDNAQFGDEMDYNRQKDAASLLAQREARDTDTWLGLGDRYRDELVGQDDRITNRNNAKAQAKQNRFQNWISGIGAAVDVVNAVNPLKLGGK